MLNAPVQVSARSTATDILGKIDTTFGTYDGILAYRLFYNLDSFGPISPGAYVSFEFEGIVGVPIPELSVVPAPNTIALVMLGVIGVGVARKKGHHGYTILDYTTPSKGIQS